jgi:hypothetical protein
MNHKLLLLLAFAPIGLNAQTITLPSGKKAPETKAKFLRTDTSSYMVDGTDSTGILGNRVLKPKPKKFLGIFRIAEPAMEPIPQIDFGNDIEIAPTTSEMPFKREAISEAVPGPVKQVRVWLETDFYTYNAFGGDLVALQNWMLANFNGAAQLHQKSDSWLTCVKLFIWDKPSPYDTCKPDSKNYLNCFLKTRPANSEADLFEFISINGNWGGRHYLNILNNPTYRHGVNCLQKNPIVTPTYSWNPHCLAHEIGHGIFDNHTQTCNIWPSPVKGKTAPIDTCYFLENGCSSPLVPRIGSLMSYCHITGSVDFRLGFGCLPTSGLQQGLFLFNGPCSYLSPCSLQVDTVFNKDNIATAYVSYPANSLVSAWKFTKNGKMLVTGSGTNAAFSTTIGISGPSGWYRFEVTGNGQIHGSDSIFVQFKVAPPLQKPIAAVLSLDSVSNRDGKYTVSLTTVANHRATSFTLNESGVQIGSGVLNPLNGGTLTFTQSKLPPGKFITYQCFTFNPAGSATSNFVQAQTFVSAPTCTAFQYGPPYGPCVNGQRTHTVIGTSPTGCIGGSPVLTEACTVPPTTSVTVSTNLNGKVVSGQPSYLSDGNETTRYVVQDTLILTWSNSTMLKMDTLTLVSGYKASATAAWTDPNDYVQIWVDGVRLVRSVTPAHVLRVVVGISGKVFQIKTTGKVSGSPSRKTSRVCEINLK